MITLGHKFGKFKNLGWEIKFSVFSLFVIFFPSHQLNDHFTYHVRTIREDQKFCS